MTFQELQTVLIQVQQRIGDSRPAYRAISDLMVSSAQLNFETEGRPNHWEALAKSTQRFKDKHGWTKILFRSGRLKASITGKDAVTGTSATIGSILAYAQIQNDGGVLNHPNRPGSVVHRYNKKTGEFLGFAKKNAKDGKRVGLFEQQFTGHSMATAVTIPARPFLLVQPEDVTRYNDILYHFWFDGVLI